MADAGSDLVARRTLGVEAKIRLREDSFLTIRRSIVGSIDQESAEEWTAQTDLQPGQPKSDRLPGSARACASDLRAEPDAPQ